jgi:hypothetical protein
MYVYRATSPSNVDYCFPNGYPELGDNVITPTGAIKTVTSISNSEVVAGGYITFDKSIFDTIPKEPCWEDADGNLYYTDTAPQDYSYYDNTFKPNCLWKVGTTWAVNQPSTSQHRKESSVSFGAWVQHDAQPPVDISGKQNTITGAASTITTNDLTASKVLASDANGKVAATSIATADAEDAVNKRHTQNTDTKIVSGNNKVEVTSGGVSIVGYTVINAGGEKFRVSSNGVASLANTSVTGNLSVSGNLNVTGKETVEEIVNIKSENNFITLRDGAQTAIASGSLSGTKVENYDGLGNDLLFGTDASGVFRIGDDGGTLEPIATRDEASNLTNGQLMKWDATNQRLVGTSDIAPQINSYVASKAMTEDAYWDLVSAGTVQADTLYITYDNDWEG